MITLVRELERCLVEVAARNNAEWCAAMCRVHGVPGEFGRQAWTAAARTPPLYPDALTLVPDVDPDALLARIDTTTPGASVKDSFADIDLTAAGFTTLLDAQWIHRTSGASVPGPALTWSVAHDRHTLGEWALAWDDGDGNADLFRPELLDEPDTFVLVGRSGVGTVIAGAVASRSAEAIGLSNVFALDGPDVAWPAVLAGTQSLFGATAVVGYEHGDDLAAAIRYGFDPIGPLRIWLRAT